ncbi:hypothetical protein [Parasphingorhabdus sp.]|uniref:hypothetical protein n=1 Tax=Parasphingorhabdus sp. TaxID=2709688 RepID=UPI003A9243D9
MKYVQFTVRVSPSHFRLLSSLAERRKITRYKMLGHVISKGLLAYDLDASAPVESAQIVSEIAELSNRLAEIDRVLDRTLFTACAAYSYARNSALETKRDDKQIAAEALAAFERQRAIAEVKS